MIGGRRTFQTYVATTKHDNLLFVDSIVCSSRREMTMTTDQLHSSSSCQHKIKLVSLLLISLQHEQHQTSNTTLTRHSTTATAAAVHPNHTNSEKEAGTSANAGPHYQKLYARVTHIWGNRKGQPDRSAMKGPHLERTASLITVPPASGKYELF